MALSRVALIGWEAPGAVGVKTSGMVQVPLLSQRYHTPCKDWPADYDGGRFLLLNCFIYSVDSSFFFNRIYIEILDKPDYVLPDSMTPKTPLGHLPDCFFLGPVTDRYAIDRTHEAGAVSAVLAVNKDRGIVFVRNNL